MTVRVELPDGVRCAVALSYDLEMCAGYSPVLVNHGRIMPPLRNYTLGLCATAEEFGVRLQFFYVGNGLEDADIEYLHEILRRGHTIDNHTYNHISLTDADTDLVRQELALTSRRLEEQLGVTSTVLRGPGGYPGGLNLLPANQAAVLESGFRWVSGHTDSTMGHYGPEHDDAAAGRLQAYTYPNGLIELPIQGWMDRIFFDFHRCRDAEALETWRRTEGHQPVPAGWACPWTDPAALDDWIDYNLAALDHAYEHRLLWVPVWHPYTHYLHDPHNRALPALLAHARAKPDAVLICTVREAVKFLRVE
ncbi:MAG TPA: polysaccharide deacetylase family protein [Chloroflexota bacterium]|nr:polysaccharide deacetylase family protein [Chloroflexota bacterium]